MTTSAKTREKPQKKKTASATGKTDWARLDAMTEEEINAAARTDADNLPMEDYPPGRWRRLPKSWGIRRRLHLTQEPFADKFRIPVATIRD